MARTKKQDDVITTTTIRDFYPRHEVVKAIRWATGLPKTAAEQVYVDTCPQFHNLTMNDYRVYGSRRSVRA